MSTLNTFFTNSTVIVFNFFKWEGFLYKYIYVYIVVNYDSGNHLQKETHKFTKETRKCAGNFWKQKRIIRHFVHLFDSCFKWDPNVKPPRLENVRYYVLGSVPSQTHDDVKRKNLEYYYYIYMHISLFVMF